MSEAQGKPIRSPSYPSMGLREAIDLIAKIEKTYRSSPVDRLLAAKLIGYSSASGPANKALADLAAFGLLERAGKGEARVTPRARAILHADNEHERRENLLAAASEPDLFRELRERFAEIPVPPEDGVIRYLNRQEFNPSAIRPATKAFLQTMEFVEELLASESHREKSAAEAESPRRNTEVMVMPPHEPERPYVQNAPSARTGVPMFESERIAFSEEAGPNQYIRLIASGEIDENLVEALEDYLKRLRKRLGKSSTQN